MATYNLTTGASDKRAANLTRLITMRSFSPGFQQVGAPCWHTPREKLEPRPA
jgi:hypothetical protein